MNNFSFVLSKEHKTLPISELKAVLEVLDPDYSITLNGYQGIIETNTSPELLSKRLAFTRSIGSVEIEHGFSERVPNKRPFKNPVSLSPKLARAMVNLSRPKIEDNILDPFCGTGGILLEANLIGFKATGVDISLEMIEGCQLNLEYFGLNKFDLYNQDAFGFQFKTNCIATDPPYGKNTVINEPIEDFYEKILLKVQEWLNPLGYACLSCPDSINLLEIGRKIGLIPIEEHIYYLNKDLSKRISIFRK